MEVRGGADAGGAIVTPGSGDCTRPPGAEERRALDEEKAQRSDKALAAMAVEAILFFAFAVTGPVLSRTCTWFCTFRAANARDTVERQVGFSDVHFH